MAINIYSVQNNLEEKGWRLLSEEYKNLKTSLFMECPKGHKIEQTYEFWRKHDGESCPICLSGDKTTIQKEIPKKELKTNRILALDAATVTTGYAIYDNKKLVFYNHITISGEEVHKRINEFKRWLSIIITSQRVDAVGLEHIFEKREKEENSRNLEVYRKLANLQGVIIDTLIDLNIPYALIMPSEWRKTCLIADKEREKVKVRAIEKVSEWYGVPVTEDEAEAICLGKHAIKILCVPKWGEEI